MKTTSLTERQMNTLLTLGKAVDDALTEFRGRTPADVATAAHQAYSLMASLQLPSPGLVSPAPKARKRAKSKKKPATKAKTVKATDDKSVSIMEVLRKAKKPILASEISEKTGIPGQGLGPTLRMMADKGEIVKKAVDGNTLWGSKVLNGKAVHAPN